MFEGVGCREEAVGLRKFHVSDLRRQFASSVQVCFASSHARVKFLGVSSWQVSVAPATRSGYAFQSLLFAPSRQLVLGQKVKDFTAIPYAEDAGIEGFCILLKFGRREKCLYLDGCISHKTCTYIRDL